MPAYALWSESGPLRRTVHSVLEDPSLPILEAYRQEKGPVTALALSPHGQRLAWATQQRLGTMHLLDLQSGDQQMWEGYGRALAFSGDGGLAAYGSGGPALYKDGQWVPLASDWDTTLSDHLCFSADGRLLAGTSHTSVVVLDLRPQRKSLWAQIRKIPDCFPLRIPQDGWVTGLALRADGRVLASCVGGQVRLWSIPEGQLLGSANWHGQAVTFHADGHLVTGWGSEVCQDPLAAHTDHPSSVSPLIVDLQFGPGGALARVTPGRLYVPGLAPVAVAGATRLVWADHVLVTGGDALTFWRPGVSTPTPPWTPPRTQALKVPQRGYAEGELALTADGAVALLHEPVYIDGRSYELPPCESLQFSPTGRFLVAATARHRQLVAILDRHQGKLLSIPSHLQSESLQIFDADQRLLVTNHFGVFVYSLPDFALELYLQPHSRELDAQREAMRDAPPGCRVALPALHLQSTASCAGHYLTSDYEGLQLWDARRGLLVAQAPLSPLVSLSSEYLAGGGHGISCHLFRLPDLAPIGPLGTGCPHFCPSRDDLLCLWSRTTGNVQLWDVSSRSLVWEQENVVWHSWVGDKLLLCRANGWELLSGEARQQGA